MKHRFFSALIINSTLGFINQIWSYHWKPISEMLGTHRKMKRQVDGTNHQCDLALGVCRFLVKMTPCTYLLWKIMFEKAVLPQEIAEGYTVGFFLHQKDADYGEIVPYLNTRKEGDKGHWFKCFVWESLRQRIQYGAALTARDNCSWIQQQWIYCHLTELVLMLQGSTYRLRQHLKQFKYHQLIYHIVCEILNYVNAVC